MKKVIIDILKKYKWEILLQVILLRNKYIFINISSQNYW